MLQSMSNGAAALSAFQTAISVESNNAANTNTAGFKTDTVSFSDMMYSNQVGMGSYMDDPRKNFSQGGLKPTTSEYDFAIEGEGFFTIQDPATPDKLYYTRTGQFKSDKENFLTTSTGMVVMGVKPEVTGDVITSEYINNVGSIVIDTFESTYSLNTYATDYNKSAKEIEEVLNNLSTIEAYNDGTATQEQIDFIEENLSLLANYDKYSTEVETLANITSGNGYKSIDSLLADIDNSIYLYESALKTFAANPIEGEVATKSQSSIIFPSLDNPDAGYTIEMVVDGVKFQQNFDESIENTLILLSDKINELAGVVSNVDTTTGELTINGINSGQNVSVTNTKLNDNNLLVNKIGDATGSGRNLVDALYLDLQNLLGEVGATATKNKSEIVNPESGSAPTLEAIVLDLNELGLSSVLYEKLLSGDPEAIASYPGIESEDGNIYLRDGDARFLVGKLAPVTFGDLSQLKPEGDNMYSRGINTGEPLYVDSAAKVVGRYLENSNVDLSKELVNLISFQKAFEANSKSISTSDELLKTALALKNN